MPASNIAHGPLGEAERLSDGRPCAASRPEKAESGPHMRLFLSSKIGGHLVTLVGIQNFGST